MGWETGQGERVCVSHYMRTMCMNIWRSVIPIGPGKRNTMMSCWKIDLEIQPENGFQVIWSPKASEGLQHMVT